MTSSVRFCLSYDPLKWDSMAFKMNFISIKKHVVEDGQLSVTLHVQTKVLLHMILYDFYDMTLSTE